MATLNFDPNPAIGDTYTENGVTYQWDGTKWTATGGEPADSLDDRYVQVAGDLMTGGLTAPTLAATGAVTGASVTATGAIDGASVTATGNVQSASQNGGPLAGFRNQLINGNMSIWQRGPIGAATAGYQTADRWRINGNRATIINNGPDGVGSCLQASVAGETLSIRQPIELLLRTGDNPAPEPFLLGTTWTLSFLAEDSGGTGGTVDANLSWSTGGSSSGTLAHAAAAQQNITGSWAKYSFTFEITNATMDNAYRSLNCNIILNGSAGGNLRLTQVQLEPGPVATPFEQRPAGTEFSLCERYYQKMRGGDKFPTPVTRPTSGFVEFMHLFNPVGLRDAINSSITLSSPTVYISKQDDTTGQNNITANNRGWAQGLGFKACIRYNSNSNQGTAYGGQVTAAFDSEL